MPGNWTYADLKTADAALGIADLATAASTLAAQTVNLSQPAGDIGLGDIQGKLLLSGDWLKIQARTADAITTGDNTDPVIVAKLAVGLVGGKAQTIGAADWQSFLNMLTVLKTATDVQQTTYDAIAALATTTAAKWQPAPTAGDIQTARSMA